MKYYCRFILFLVVLLFVQTLYAQEQAVAVDSLTQQNDSLVQALRCQVQELQMQSILMREQLEKSGNLTPSMTMA